MKVKVKTENVVVEQVFQLQVNDRILTRPVFNEETGRNRQEPREFDSEEAAVRFGAALLGSGAAEAFEVISFYRLAV